MRENRHPKIIEGRNTYYVTFSEIILWYLYVPQRVKQACHLRLQGTWDEKKIILCATICRWIMPWQIITGSRNLICSRLAKRVERLNKKVCGVIFLLYKLNEYTENVIFLQYGALLNYSWTSGSMKEFNWAAYEKSNMTIKSRINIWSMKIHENTKISTQRFY